jgi:hypothetical protein
MLRYGLSALLLLWLAFVGSVLLVPMEAALGAIVVVLVLVAAACALAVVLARSLVPLARAILRATVAIFHAEVGLCERAARSMTGEAEQEDDKAEAARKWVRALVLAAFLVAFALALLVPEPKSLPGVFLGSDVLLKLWVFGVAFLGGLLVVTPLYRGVCLGTLPIEVSPRGARYEEIARSTYRIEDRLKGLEESQKDLLAAVGKGDEQAEAVTVKVTDLNAKVAKIERETAPLVMRWHAR